MDFGYIRLGQDSIQLDAPGPTQPVADYRFTLVQTELFGAYRANPAGKTRFDLLGGARINSQMSTNPDAGGSASTPA